MWTFGWLEDYEGWTKEAGQECEMLILDEFPEFDWDRGEDDRCYRMEQGSFSETRLNKEWGGVSTRNVAHSFTPKMLPEPLGNSSFSCLSVCLWFKPVPPFTPYPLKQPLQTSRATLRSTAGNSSHVSGQHSSLILPANTAISYVCGDWCRNTGACVPGTGACVPGTGT